MRQDIMNARATLEELLETDQLTRGLYVRVHGQTLVVGREEPLGPEKELQRDDRLRLTRLNSSTFGLSVKRHNGRWERTPFSGTLKEMVQAIKTFMQHLIAAY